MTMPIIDADDKALLAIIAIRAAGIGAAIIGTAIVLAVAIRVFALIVGAG